MSDEYIKKEIVCMKKLNIFANDIAEECRKQYCSNKELYSKTKCCDSCLKFAFKEMQPLLRRCNNLSFSII